MSTLMTVARQLTSSATTVAGAGVRTGLSVATHLTMGARRLAWARVVRQEPATRSRPVAAARLPTWKAATRGRSLLTKRGHAGHRW